jgi:hypothetical protein
MHLVDYDTCSKYALSLVPTSAVRAASLLKGPQAESVGSWKTLWRAW